MAELEEMWAALKYIESAGMSKLMYVCSAEIDREVSILVGEFQVPWEKI